MKLPEIEIEKLKRDAETGSTQALISLGDYWYRDDMNFAPNKEKAFSYYRAAYEKGDPDAAYELSFCYERGIGVPVDEERAYAYLREAADGGSSDAKWALASEFARGTEYAPQNKELAKKLFIEAAETNMDYMTEIADYYMDVDEAILRFYESLEGTEEKSQEVSVNIPKENEAAVMAFLEQLRRGEPTHLPDKAKNLPVAQTSSRKFTQEKPRIYNHPDIDKLLAVYHGQSSAEKRARMTTDKNNVGFNCVDADTLSTIAKHFLDHGFITNSELAEVSHRIRKYRRQWETQTNKTNKTE